MKLPFVDEIRAVRARLMEAQSALQHLGRVDAALVSLAVLERHTGTPVTPPLPGDEVLAELADDWDHLGDLASGAAPANAAMATQMAARRAQLELARQHLAPIGREVGQHGQRMHGLQHQQQHALDSAEFAPALRELRTLSAERDRLTHELTPLQQRHGVVGPTLNTLSSFLDRIQSELDEHRGAADTRGLHAWRTATLVDTLVRSLDALLRVVDLELPFPDPPGAPAEPDPEATEALWSAVECTHGMLRDLHATLSRQQGDLGRRMAAAQEELDGLNAQLLERMG